ncbi:MAG: hypothetical protein K2J01_01350 [Clostridiales bacterium]|nr:hypothetical protein [Clostridiales bacterium]
MKDPYKVLGLDKSADPETIRAKYQELHDLYGEQRFRSGEEGNEGARKLQELEEAWALISADLSHDNVSGGTAVDFGTVDELIRQGKYDEAQDMLDCIQDRNGEWHYMQAIIFYKREWLTDSKTQLEMALREDPNNSKYRASLDKLNLAMGVGQHATQNQNQQNNQNTNPNPNNYGGQNGGGYYDYGGGQQPQDMANCLSTCCCAYCLTDCLCNAMRCC